MGVEDGEHHRGEQDSVPPQDHLVQTPVPQKDGKQRAEGRCVAVPVTVVTQAELEELQAKAAKYDQQRRLARARDEKWRKSHPDEVKRRTRERVAAYRARQRGADQ